MTIYLGIDGGGSTCRARAQDASGHVLAEASAGPANIASDLEGALASVHQAARAVLGDVPLSQVHACLGLAGANDTAAAEKARARLGFGRLLLVTDGHVSVRGALGQGDGIVAAIGTGSVFASQRGGVQREVGGKGLILGDEGSGAWLGRALLAAALRALDGFQPETPLLSQTLNRYGGAPGIIAFAATARPADFAALAPEVTASQDPAAQSILTRARADVREAVALLQGPDRLPVVCLGGLAPAYAPDLARHWPLAQPQGSALDGAMDLARSL